MADQSPPLRDPVEEAAPAGAVVRHRGADVEAVPGQAGAFTLRRGAVWLRADGRAPGVALVHGATTLQITRGAAVVEALDFEALVVVVSGEVAVKAAGALGRSIHAGQAVTLSLDGTVTAPEVVSAEELAADRFLAENLARDVLTAGVGDPPDAGEQSAASPEASPPSPSPTHAVIAAAVVSADPARSVASAPPAAAVRVDSVPPPAPPPPEPPRAEPVDPRPALPIPGQGVTVVAPLIGEDDEPPPRSGRGLPLLGITTPGGEVTVREPGEGAEPPAPAVESPQAPSDLRQAAAAVLRGPEGLRGPGDPATTDGDRPTAPAAGPVAVSAPEPVESDDAGDAHDAGAEGAEPDDGPTPRRRRRLLVVLLVLALIAAVVGALVLTSDDEEPGTASSTAPGASVAVSSLPAAPGDPVADLESCEGTDGTYVGQGTVSGGGASVTRYVVVLGLVDDTGEVYAEREQRVVPNDDRAQPVHWTASLTVAPDDLQPGSRCTLVRVEAQHR